MLHVRSMIICVGLVICAGCLEFHGADNQEAEWQKGRPWNLRGLTSGPEAPLCIPTLESSAFVYSSGPAAKVVSGQDLKETLLQNKSSLCMCMVQ